MEPVGSAWMDGAALDEVKRYRASRWVRDALPALWLLPLVFAALSASTYRDLGALVLPAAFVAAAAIATAIAASRVQVTLTPDVVILAGVTRTRAIRWADIVTIRPVGKAIAIDTPNGIFVTPVSASARANGTNGEGPSMRDALVQAWAARRGEHWGVAPPHPWTPTYDRRGRVVLRPASGGREWNLVGAVVGAQVGSALASAGSSETGFKLMAAAVFGAVALALAIAYHHWRRVAIDSTGVRTRTLVFGSRAVPWAAIQGIVEVEDQLPIVGRKPKRLGLMTAQGIVRLAAPFTTWAFYGHDPDYYRKWVWLHDEVARHQAALPVGPPIGTYPLA